ncbi:hypothetical protein ATK17_0703 [Branchiibius hedensis]|uniref:Uncharacterized protein n=1 Tax=Branchiibius hedensis TaxID=672460 RepID=A0A2Y8ZLU5_9MICO|nr:hypothetical protein [Branchiibius hedensis]PWJ24604.1 hypothetical protein ATK17_0703 [Branchiibius hedensis]SSA33421.1 hypothetical protein SAMN04489750_0703 [Branchiibius hedensis]
MSTVTRRWVRRGLIAVVVGTAAWLVLSYFYLGPWLPGILALALAAMAIIAMTRDAGTAWIADRWPLDGDEQSAAAATLPTDARTRRLRRLCAQVTAGAATDAEAAELAAALAALAPGRPIPDVRRIDAASLARIVTLIEET